MNRGGPKPPMARTATIVVNPLGLGLLDLSEEPRCLAIPSQPGKMIPRTLARSRRPHQTPARTDSNYAYEPSGNP